MIAHIVRIGNSHGIRIPKPLLEQTGMTDAVELRVEGQSIILEPAAAHPRAGWAEAFRLMHERGDDQLIDASTTTAFDRTEWEW